MMTFTLQLTHYGTGTCFTWNMGDGSPLITMGTSSCQSNMTGNFITVDKSDTLTYSHRYSTEGLFNVIVTGSNVVSMATISSLAMISGISCYYPIVTFNGGRRTVNKPVRKLVSESVNLESTAIIDCEVSNGQLYQWKVYKVIEGDTYLNHYFEPYNVNITIIYNLKVYFEPKSFEPGLYRISLNVSMVGIHGLYTEEYTYLSMEASPLIAMVKGGNTRVVSFNKMLDIDGLSESYDPDSNVKGQLEFEWWCKRQEESFDDALWDVIEIIEAEDTGNMSSDRGGCFGTGIGRLPQTDGVLHISSLQLGPNSVNVFRLIVKQGDRQAQFEQVIHVVDGDKPTIYISCKSNCKSKMNPSSEFAVQAVCESCLSWDRIYYNWSLYLHEDEGGVIQQDLHGLLLTDASGAGLAFKPGVLTGGRVYHLRLDMKVYGYNSTFTEFMFKTNLPPYGGNCSIYPHIGFALNTKFEIKCYGWMNPGEEQFQGEGLLYRFWTKVRGGSDTQLLYYGTDPFTAPSKFPLGRRETDYKHDIIVRISNTIGEYIETTLEAEVGPLPLQDLDEVRALASDDSSLLITMKEAGQDQEFKQLIVAMASVLNPQPLDTLEPEDVPVIQSTTSAESISNLDHLSTVPTSQLQEEDKQKNTEMRSNIIHHLSETDHVTLDALQQTALCFKVITKQTDELTEETQEKAVEAITHMTEEFTKILEEPTRQQTNDQALLAAEEMLASVGNVMLAALTEAVSHLNELTIQDTTDDYNDNDDAEPADGDNKDDDVNEIHTDDHDAESINKAKEIITKAFEVKDKIVETIVKTRTPGQDLTLKTDAFLIHTRREEVSKIGQGLLSSESATFSLPSSQILTTNNSISGQFVDLNIVEFSTNPFLWSDSARFINSQVVSLDLVDGEGHTIEVKNLSEPIVIDITHNGEVNSGELVQALYYDIEELQYHRMKVRSNNSDMHIVIKPTLPNIKLQVYVQHAAIPTTQLYDLTDVVPHTIEDNVSGLPVEVIDELTHTVVIPSNVIQQYGTGWWYVGIRQYGLNQNMTEPIEDLSMYYDYVAEPIAAVNYSINFITSGCYYWDIQENTWSTAGCQISAISNSQFTRCICNHLTSFGSEFFVPPNSINLVRVILNMEDNIKDNHAVLAMLCTVIVLYGVGVIWAWRKDKQDVQKWGVLPLCDNILTDAYFYEITVFTGLRRGAGTRSNISFVLAGDSADTGVRQLRDIKGVKFCDRGTINKFILSVDEPLGPLSYIRIWHDNSGVGIMQGWYLSKIVVRELQGHEQVYVFLCNRWLALEEDDGMVDRLLPVALREDLIKFGNLFYSDTRKRLTDSHLWISVFSRPNRSSFTRVQRLSCIFSLLMTSMLASAMFYKADESVGNSLGYKLGPFNFTSHEMYTSFITSLIVLPVNILIDQIFRRCKPQKVKKGQAFSFDRPLSTLSKFSVNFTNIFRSQTRTQVTPINDEDECKGDNSAYRPDTVASLSMPELEMFSNNSSASNSPPGVAETPAPAVFIKASSNPPSPSFHQARHHYTPAPPLQLKVTRFKPPVLDINTDKDDNVGCSQPCWLDMTSPSPSNSGCLTPNMICSVDNSPNISPSFVGPSPTGSVFSFESTGEEIEKITTDTENNKTKRVASWKLVLPYWCVYIAWSLVFFSSGVSAIVTFLYSMEWGKDKSIAWLTSMILTIVESVSVIQPTKIVLLAVFVAVFLRKTEDETMKEDDEEVESSFLDEIPPELAVKNTNRTNVHIASLDPDKLATLREQRVKEIKMFRILQEIAFYMFYLLVLILVASHNRDSNSYRVKHSLLNVISPKNNISKVHNIKDIWHWVNHLVIPQLYTLHDWNNISLLDAERLIATQASYRVGPVRLRQHRVRQVLCDRPSQMLPYIDQCSFGWSQGYDDKMSYGEGWMSLPSNQTSRNNVWVYRTTSDNEGIPYAGEIGVYSGGGYVADLIGGLNHVTNMAASLQNLQWIDKYTRVLFIEFTIYNPNTNLFTTALISFEMPTSGKILSRSQIFTFRLFSYLGSFGIFVILCELMALVCVFYFVGLELKQIRRDGRQHFCSFWNCLQFVTLLTSVMCVVMYLLKHALTSNAVHRVTKLKDQFYNFQRIAMWDEVFHVLLAFVIFSSILKLIHILRFNRRMSMLAGTLKLAAREMTAFSIVFVIVLVAFVGSGYILFGSSNHGFRSVFKGFETLLSFSLGSYDFHTIIEEHRILGPVYFGLFFTFVMFVLINMFVTILNEAFTMVHKDVVNQRNDYEIVEFILERLKNWIGVDFNKIITDVKHKYLKGEQKSMKQQVPYTLDDIDHKLDELITSLDAICHGYIMLKDDHYR